MKSLSGFLNTHPRKVFCCLAIILLSFLYWRALSSPFVYDDLDQIVNNPNLGDWNSFAHRFLLHPVDLTSSLLSSSGSTYRPVFWISLFIDKQIWNVAPFGYHLTNLLLHFLNGLLVFLLLLRLSLNEKAAMAIALIWLSLPIDTEVVAWTSGRAYLLCTLFILTALLTALASVRRGGLALNTATFLASLLAVLSHELGVLILPMLVLLGLGFERDKWKRLLSPVLACAIAVLLVVVWRVHLGVKDPTSLATPKWALLAFSQYLDLIFLPVHMSVERSTSMTLGHLTIAAFVALGCFGLGLIYALSKRLDTSPWLLTGLIWLALCVAPFCLVQNYQGLAERFAYLAALGAAVAVVTLCLQPARAGVRKAILSVVGFWCLWNLYRTSVRVEDWTDPVRLYEASLMATPQSPSLHYNLAFSHRERGELSEAILEYQHTLKLAPDFPHAYASLGDVYLKEDHYPEAQAAYSKALAVTPNDTSVLLNSGAAYQDAGDATRAEQAYQRVLQIDPKSSAAHVNLGVLYVSKQRTSDAMHQFAMAIDLKSQDNLATSREIGSRDGALQESFGNQTRRPRHFAQYSVNPGSKVASQTRGACDLLTQHSLIVGTLRTMQRHTGEPSGFPCMTAPV